MQFVLCEVPGQGNNLAALGPGAEQATDTEEPLIPGLGPQFTQYGQPGVAAVADDVVV